MSTGLYSPILEPIHSERSSRTSSRCNNDLTEVNSNTPLLLSSVGPSKKIRICTLCGRYEGLRSVPKSSLLSFHL